jgi:hypothetical protein
MAYRYWAKAKDGNMIFFWDENFYDIGTVVTVDGTEYVIEDMTEEFLISVSEMLEVYEEERGDWK